VLFLGRFLNKTNLTLYMTKRENILPFATIGDLIGENTGKRVSKDAKTAAAELLEAVTEKIIRKAALLADHNKRKTVKAKDILLAYNQVKEDL
jgi:histone H3/H4